MLRSFLCLYLLIRSSALNVLQLPPLLPAVNVETGQTRSFISNDNSACFQGPARQAEAALALFRSMPRGALFNQSKIRAADCASKGYVASLGNDMCDPGVEMLLQDPGDVLRVKSAVDNELERYGSMFGIDLAAIQLMEQCSCTPSSMHAQTVQNLCSGFPMTGAWVDHNPFDGKGLVCYEGPVITATRSLAVLKASPLLPMHLNDQIAPVHCRDLGFLFQNKPNEGTCFVGLYKWTKSQGNDLADNLASDITASLYASRYESETSATLYQRDSILDSVLGCQCSGTSYVRGLRGIVCMNPNSRPPVRDWFDD